jgi:hypothetical protein
MATTTRSSNGRSKQAGTRSTAAANRSANGTSRSRAARSSRSSANRSSGASAKRKIAKAKTPLVAGGAAAAGLATGTALGALLRGSRRPRALGVPLPRGNEMKAGAKKAVSAGRWLYDMETDLRLLREHAEHSRRQSPIEVLLSGLTSRTLPRGR